MNFVQRYRIKRDFLFSIYNNASWVYKVLLALLFALATAYASQVCIFLPWTPVPITMQTFVVLLSAVVLGSRWGVLSQIFYLGIGVCGIPLFAGMQCGLGVIFGPRGGYLLGFIITSWVLGYFLERFIEIRTFWRLLFIIISVYTICVYGLGCLGLGVWLYSIKGACPHFNLLMSMGVLPFLIGDSIKIIGVCLIGSMVLPKKKVL